MNCRVQPIIFFNATIKAFQIKFLVHHERDHQSPHQHLQTFLSLTLLSDQSQLVLLSLLLLPTLHQGGRWSLLNYVQDNLLPLPIKMSSLLAFPNQLRAKVVLNKYFIRYFQAKKTLALAFKA